MNQPNEASSVKAKLVVRQAGSVASAWIFLHIGGGPKGEGRG